MISDILLNKVLLKARSSQYHWQGLVFSIYSSRRMLGEVKSKLRYYYNKGLFLINLTDSDGTTTGNTDEVIERHQKWGIKISHWELDELIQSLY